MKTRIIMLLIPMLVVAACSTTNDCVCPEYYSPVCGENGKTYANPCMAECSGVDYIEGECPVYGFGSVEYSGDTTCGFYIRIFGIPYKPQSLSEEFRIPNLTVSIRYRKMNTWFTCDEPYGVFQEVQIMEITEIK